MQVRLAIAQGPVQALAVASAVRRREQVAGTALANVLVIADVLYVADEALLPPVIRECAAGVHWKAVVEATGYSLLQRVQQAIGFDFVVREYISSRSPHPLPWALHELFPDARRVTVGDGFGLLNVFPESQIRLPQYDLAVAAIPQRLMRGSDDAASIDTVPSQIVREVIECVRAGNPQLRAMDSILAAFVRGGTLALTGYETEGGDMTLRGEIVLTHHLISRAVTPGSPVLLKPHPRASLGQAAAIARRLRAEGHPVRVIPRGWASYPLEVFSETMRAPAVVQGGFSSAALSVKYLTNRSARVELPAHLAVRYVLPLSFRFYRRAISNTRRVLAVLESWNGRTPLELRPLERAGLLGRTIGFGPHRLLQWRRVAAAEAATGRPTPADANREWFSVALGLGQGADLTVVTDPVWGLTLAMSPTVGDEAPETTLRAVKADSQLDALAEIVDSLPPDCAFVLEIETNPPAYAPAWHELLRNKRTRLPGRARAEEVEDVLELSAEVTYRSPELSDTGRLIRRGIQAGPVRFVARTRPRSSPSGVEDRRETHTSAKRENWKPSDVVSADE